MFDESRLERLVDAYFDQQLTAAEKRELETMLLGSSRAREIFLDRSDWHGLTREWAMQRQAEMLMGDIDPPAKVVPFRRKAWLGAGIAACALLGWWLLPQRAPQPDAGIVEHPANPARDDVALLAQAIDVEWETGSHSVGTALPKGLLKIARGTLRLDFYSGARVILEGPATLDLLSQDLARLDHGKLTARVPPPAEGFTILNANLRVIDRGTEFGMSVNGSDDCEVHVFDGEVELQGEVPDTAARALFEGEAVSIRQGKSSPITADRRSFADPASMMQAAARDSAARMASWRARSEAFRQLPDLLVYYNFEDLEPGSMIVQNQASGADEATNGSVIGCETLSGRWSKKLALGFAKTSDRVRFRAQGLAPALTMMAWVRVDSLPQAHNSLLSMSPDQLGEIHWKLDQSGRLLLGMRSDGRQIFESWERLVSPTIVTGQDFGRWIHFATVIDSEQGVMRHYVNGKEVVSAPMMRRVPVQLGLANLGNFDASSPDRQEIGELRNFNGRIDEFALFRRALSEEEIAAMK
ncbi:LamG-like jellyroll fold domain-containing protein [Luteolibacter marinus]|uniref:LamG-like jellyroll fold domain-containing protein n=1 Tax=Luteolibacter marinus TaxID=2776705 RepID=UPI00186744A4|nr:LamG-like jellyroll fold domain-containing protein [Luteolibacter marinus]